MDSSPPEILIDEATPRVYSKRRKNERAKTYSPPSSPAETTPRHISSRQQNVPSNVSSLAISVEEAERSLSELIDDFEHGKLQAFGSPLVVQRMQDIRMRQENLTKRHFELDRIRVNRKNSSKKLEPYSGLGELTQELEHLTKEIQNLHNETQHSAPSSRGRSISPINNNTTSTPHPTATTVSKPLHELFLTPAAVVPEHHWSSSKNDSQSSLNTSRDEADVDYPPVSSDQNKSRNVSHTSSCSSGVQQETIV